MNAKVNNQKKRTAEEKMMILKRHLLKGEKVSEICESESLAPSMFYKWQQALFDNGAKALENKPKSAKNSESTRIQQLQKALEKAETKLTEKHEVLSELMSDHLQLKKNLGC